MLYLLFPIDRKEAYCMRAATIDILHIVVPGSCMTAFYSLPPDWPCSRCFLQLALSPRKRVHSKYLSPTETLVAVFNK